MHKLTLTVTVTLGSEILATWQYHARYTTRRGYNQAMRLAWRKVQRRWHDELDARGRCEMEVTGNIRAGVF